MARLRASAWMAWLWLGLLAFTPAGAESRRGKVVEVISGDSLLFEDAQGRKHHLRLFAVAAPEGRQPHAAESRRGLADLAQGKHVTVDVQREDDQGNLVGKLLVPAAHCATCPPSRDAALAQLEGGHVWWHRDERRQQVLLDQGYYEYAEFDARQRRRGLWRDEVPVPPWEWRKRQGRPVTSDAGRTNHAAS